MTNKGSIDLIKLVGTGKLVNINQYLDIALIPIIEKIIDVGTFNRHKIKVKNNSVTKRVPIMYLVLPSEFSRNCKGYVGEPALYGVIMYKLHAIRVKNEIINMTGSIFLVFKYRIHITAITPNVPAKPKTINIGKSGPPTDIFDVGKRVSAKPSVPKFAKIDVDDISLFPGK